MLGSEIMKLWFLSFLLSFYAFHGYTYFTFLDNGEVLQEGDYIAQAALQGLTSAESKGVNLIAQIDTNAGRDSNFRIQLGSGTTDYFGGFFYKWSPIPDVEQQPALGVVLGTIVARENDKSLAAIPLKGFINKKFHFHFATLAPYIALSTSILVGNDTEGTPTHFITGTEWFPTENANYSIYFEFGGNVSDAFNYFAASFSYKLSEERPENNL